MPKVKFNLEKIKHHYFYLLSTAYVLSIFYAMSAFNNDLMDPTLLPRMLVCLFINVIFFVLIFTSGEAKKLLEVWMKWPYVLFTLFWIWNCIAMFWAPVYAEAAMEVARVGIFMLIFVLSGYFASRDKHFLQKVILISYAYGFFVIYISMHETSTLPETGHWYRYFVHALSGHKNLLSSMLFLLSGLAIAGFFVLPWYLSGIGLGLIYFYGYFIYFLETRAVFLAVACTILFFIILATIIFRQKIRFLYLSALIFFMVIFSLVTFYFAGPIVSKIQEELIASNIQTEWRKEERLVLWAKTLEIWKQQPILGYGPGQWQFEFLKANYNGLEDATNQNFTFQRPHNDFLWIWFELGSIGLILYLLFLMGFIAGACRPMFIKKAKFSVEIVLVSLFIGMLIISFFDFPKERMEHCILMSFVIAYLTTSLNSIPLKEIFAKYLQWLVAFVIIGFNVFLIQVLSARWKGEYYVKKLKKAYEMQDYQQVSILAGKAKSPLYVCDPTSTPLAWFESLARFYLKSPDFGLNAALEAFNISPNNVHVVNQLAVAFEAVGNHERAKEFFCKALDLYTPYDAARFNLAVIYYYEGNYPLAYRFANETTSDNTKKIEYLKIIEEKLTK